MRELTWPVIRRQGQLISALSLQPWRPVASPLPTGRRRRRPQPPSEPQRPVEQPGLPLEEARR